MTRRRTPRRNATRKPQLYQRDAHVRDYHREIDMILATDPEDWTDPEATLIEARFRHPRDDGLGNEHHVG